MRTSEVKALCYHCGDECKQDAILWDEHNFCCEGCKTVYSLLKENDLCNYYAIEEDTARLSRKPVASKLYEYLENDEIADSFLQFKSADKAQVVFFIPDMHCSSCVWLLEKLYKILPGIQHSRVNFDRKELHVAYDPRELSFRTLVEKLSALGYEPALQSRDESKRGQKSNKALLYRLGVAGFCMGNIMLFSFPEYLGMDAASQMSFARLFQFLNLALAIPVVSFSAFPFLSGAYKGLKSKSFNIDLPLAIGILTLFSRSAYEVITLSGPGFFDSLSALVFFLLVGRWMQDKAYEALSFERDYASYFPVAVEVFRQGVWRFSSLDKLAVGERIRVKSNELIPADARLIEGDARIDYSFVTGESLAEKIGKGETVYAGGRQTAGILHLEVLKPVSQSYLTSLWNQHTKDEKKAGMKVFSDQVGKWFTLVLIALACITLAYWLPINPEKAYLAFTAVLIVACPCVLVIAAPFAFGNAMRWLGKKGIYLKNMDVVEKVAQIDTLAFDKTGTLSEGSLVSDVREFSAVSVEEYSLIRSVVAVSSHPLSRALYAHLNVFPTHDLEHVLEVPGKGIEAWVEDQHIRIGSAEWLDVEQEERSGVFVKIDERLIMHLKLRPRYRIGLDAVLNLQLSDYPKYLYSGDQAGELPILRRWFKTENMRFGCSPMDKREAIAELQDKGAHVMMLGDGLNDAGALQAADVGVAITEDINRFTPASEVIMVGKSINDLPKFIQFCRNTLKVVKGSFIFSLLYNSIWMYFAMRGELQPLIAALLMPISSITVFTINTLGIRYFARKGGIQ